MAEGDQNKALFDIDAGVILAKLHLAACESYKGIGRFFNSGIVNDQDNPNPLKVGDTRFDMSKKDGKYEIGYVIDKPIKIKWMTKEEADKKIDEEVSKRVEKEVTEDDPKKDEKKTAIVNEERAKLYNDEYTKIASSAQDAAKKQAVKALMDYLKVFLGDKAPSIKEDDLVLFNINLKEPSSKDHTLEEDPDKEKKDEENQKEMNEKGEFEVDNLCMKVGFELEKETM